MATAAQFEAEPTCAATFDGLEEEFGLPFEAEALAWLQVVEDEGSIVGIVVGVVVVQKGFYLLGHRMREGNATCVFPKEWP